VAAPEHRRFRFTSVKVHPIDSVISLTWLPVGGVANAVGEIPQRKSGKRAFAIQIFEIN
jgi:hypothetical protein